MQRPTLVLAGRAWVRGTAKILFETSRVLSTVVNAHSPLTIPRRSSLPPFPPVTRSYRRAAATPTNDTNALTSVAKTTLRTLPFSAEPPPSYPADLKDPTYPFLAQQLGLTPNQLLAVKTSIVSVLSTDTALRSLNLHSSHDRVEFTEGLARQCCFPRDVVKKVERSAGGVAGYLLYRLAVKVRKDGKLGKTERERRIELEVWMKSFLGW
ncbi:hypothetical protein K440DRAFT_304613 [Wilcoxina mikolae CBS 423.85]|nr:hypothetical protein K440DRAFT_304613 [Wilcoxina mikolae CBS 423.85]